MMDVEFKDLSYTIKRISWRSKVPGKEILKSVSGRFKSGELSAIMGPSGAGKSSLLNALSGYRTDGVTGVLTHNGKPRDSRLFHKLSCYITQEDLLQPLLTVQEAMMAAAFLKLPAHTSNKIRRSKVEEILATLGLLETRNTRTEHLSGGQRKRLSIALELINNPPIFFLDEPTSGLDNVTTRQCLQLLRTLASQGRTIVCTIHQPSASLFQMFDHVYVVAQGRCVYQGSSKDLVPFLSSAGLPCPMHYNPADFVIEVTDANDKNILALSTAIENGKLSWAGTPVKQKEPSLSSLQITDATSLAENAKLAVRVNGTGISSPAVSGDTSSEGSSVDLGTTYHRMNQLKNLQYPNSTWFQFCALMKRMLLQHSRNKLAIQLQTIHHVLCALFFGIVTYQSANDGHEMFKHVKFCTGVILFHAYTWCMAPVLLYPKEVKLMKKEYFNRWYNLTSFYFASMISKLPLMVILTLIFASVVYFMNGLPAEPYRFFCFFTIALLTSVVAEAIGMAIGATFNITNGCAVGPMVVAPFLGLAIYGFDFADQIPWLMYCVMKTSFMRCGIVGLVLTVYGLDRQDLNCDDIYCHFMKPKVVLRMLDIDKASVWQEIAALIALMVIFRAFCYYALRRRLVT